MSHSRKRARQLRPYQVLTTGLALAFGLALLLGQKGTGNPYLLAVIIALALTDAARNVALYRLLDEYERSLMLRAVAAAFLFLMVGLLVTAVLGAYTAAEAVAPITLMGLLFGAWAVFGVSHSVVQRREAEGNEEV